MNKEFDDWAEKSKKILKDNGYLNNNLTLLKIILYVFVGIIFAIILLYGLLTDGFKDEITFKLEPEIKSITENDFDFNPKTINQYDHKINLYINQTLYNCTG